MGSETFNFDRMREKPKAPEPGDPPPEFWPPHDQPVLEYACENWDESERRQYLIDLLNDVRDGRLLPSDADAAAVGPDPVRFAPTVYPLNDPQLTHWSPEMTAAWIKFREVEAVSRHFLESFEETSIWVETDKEYSPSTRTCRTKGIGRPPAKDWRSGYKLCHLEVTSLWGSFVDFDGRKQSLSPVNEWFELLHPLLIEGKIQAYGRKLGKDPKLKRIARSQWFNGSFRNCKNHGTVWDVGKLETFSHVRFSARSVIENFPALPKVAVPLVKFRPWVQDNKGGGEYRRAWHRDLHKLLLQESPHGFPVIPGKAKNRSAFLLQFLKKAKQKNDARDALLTAIGFDNHRADQNIERFIKRRCRDVVQKCPAEFGPAMASVVSEIPNIEIFNQGEAPFDASNTNRERRPPKSRNS